MLFLSPDQTLILGYLKTLENFSALSWHFLSNFFLIIFIHVFTIHKIPDTML